jgi:oligopeptide/dipeptide ABC transporter ATP-binding protein
MSEARLLLDVRDLTIAFRSGGRDLVAVDRASFSVRAGEVLGIVGESGSGKTAMALSLLRLLPEPPARVLGGQVMLEGADLLQMGEDSLEAIRGRRIGMIFQDPMSALNPVLTIGDQIMEPLRLHLGLSRSLARERALELLDRVRVPAAAERLNSYPHELSGGLRQRVMIAIAISCSPDIVIADEPTTALDVTIQAQILELLRDLQRDLGMSVIIITHDLGVIAEFAQQVCVMYAGRIVETGPVGDFFEMPAHPYTEALIKSLPEIDNPTTRLVTIEGTVPRSGDPPPGCRFEPRCGFARPPCSAALPELYPINSTQSAACIRPFDYRIPTS